ncbi:hypothetical protein [Salipiger mangrovisoli]|uniref:Inner membrane protein n=1 Tax=Salipiger mangrovisoli TaxID=2865933 RepID=A0ABR9X1B1_9RHOB|nr:hypothetical protein [Salipiger mangrovisoli]MBE9637282.1 hypothetical protein [Salipiger mangrovisoli]
MFTELVGYLACTLVLLTFCCGDTVHLRTLAITSNLCFLAYSALSGLLPIGLLHATLLIINARFLRIEIQRRRPRPHRRGPQPMTRAKFSGQYTDK